MIDSILSFQIEAKHIKKHASSFEDSTIARASAAAAPMATWVKANIRYSLVIEKIQPLQLELEEEIQVFICSLCPLSIILDTIGTL